MTSRTCHRFTLLCASVIAAACGVTDPGNGPETARPSAVLASPATDVTINLSWQDDATDESGYEVQRSSTGPDGAFVLAGRVPANTRTFPDAGRAPLTEYCYRVRTVRGTSYSAFSSTSCATTLGPPPAPSNVLAIPLEFGRVVLSWNVNPAAVGYRVQRSPAVGGPWEALVVTLPGNVIDSAGGPDLFACYKVTAQGLYGETAAGPTCTTPPASPFGLAANGKLTGGMDLTWIDRSGVEEGYEVQRSTNGVTWATIATVAANAGSYHDAGAANDTRTWYRVRAMKDGGYSAFNDATGFNATVTPGAPSNLEAMTASSTTVHVTWSDLSANESGFTLERSTNGGAWATVATTAWDVGGYFDGTLTPDVQVCYRVSAFNNRGTSTLTAVDCVAPPRAPTNLVAVPAGTGTIEFSWRDESGVENGYAVQWVRCDLDGCWGETIAVVGPGVTTVRLNGISPTLTRTYQVVAFTVRDEIRGYSDPSNAVEVAAPPD